MTEVLPVKFTNRSGLHLFGILHRPAATQREVAILLLSPGVKMRVAPHRLYNKMAERFAALGFPVLRFDYYGLGDSEGELEESVLMRVYNSIHSGRYVADTVDAIDWMQREHGFTRFIVGGLCGGAISGLLAAEGDRRIEGLLALGIPASFEGAKEHYDQFVTRGELQAMSQRYLDKLRDPGALLRFFTFKSSYRAIWRAFRARLAGRRSDSGPPPGADAATLANLNPKFGPAFMAMLHTSRPILLVFSGNDRWRWEFEEKFEGPNQSQLEPHRRLYEKHTIADANHILSSPVWFEAMMGLSEAWLQRMCPEGRTLPAGDATTVGPTRQAGLMTQRELERHG